MIRGFRALVIVPKVELLFRPFEPGTNVVFGPRSSVWLRVLNVSARNCSFTASTILVSLIRDKFRLTARGLRTSGRTSPMFPRVQFGGLTNCEVSNHSLTV